jgi:predicted nucleic acid-binding Zn finger protein
MPEDKHVRFYFGVSVSCLIPPNPHGKRDGVSDDDWREDNLRQVSNDLDTKLSEVGFEVAYRKHKPIDGALRLYAADFVVSALHMFPAAQLIAFGRVRKGHFSKAKSILESKIANLLKSDYVVNAITYEYAACRTFFFEVYLGGFLELKHVISPNEINAAGGSVREAIEYFNSEVVNLLKECGYDADPQTTRSRPKDSIYKFELSGTKIVDFPENGVFGLLAYMEKDMPRDDAENLYMDCDDQILKISIEVERDRLAGIIFNCFLESLPGVVAVIHFSLDFVDCEENICDYYDEGV